MSSRRLPVFRGTLRSKFLLSLTLIIERFMYYRRARGNAEEIVAKVKAAGTLSEALTAIEDAPGVSGRVFRSAIQAARDAYEKALHAARERLHVARFDDQVTTQARQSSTELRRNEDGMPCRKGLALCVRH